MLRLINQRIKAGVDVRIFGKVGKRGAGLRVQKVPEHRIAHPRDDPRRRHLFVGSQSLRASGARRAAGGRPHRKEPKTVKRMLEVFEDDWSKTDLAAKEAREATKKEIKGEEGFTEELAGGGGSPVTRSGGVVAWTARSSRTLRLRPKT